MIQQQRNQRAIIAHQFWGRGGAESAAMWIVEALVHEYAVTIYTRGGFDLEELNTLAGTQIPADNLTIRLANIGSGRTLGALKSRAFMHSLADVGAAFDLRVTASGILPWGLPALHFLTSVEWSPALTKRVDPGHKVALRGRLSRWLADFSMWRKTDMSQDVFIANSEWLKERCEPLLPAPIQVIHPVLPGLPEAVRPQDRGEVVLVFGRISPEKRVEDAIQIVELARASGFSGRMVIAGPDGVADYVARIRGLASEREWVDVLTTQTGADKTRLLNSAKYGLNTCQIEAFGISTAEMAASGIITLVPANTGQSEIIDSPAQQFESVDDAANKLVTLSQDAYLGKSLQANAYRVRNRFNAAHFTSAVQESARDMLLLNSRGRS
jgi:glycosyltransferase involved in cell wall biosynthesis